MHVFKVSLLRVQRPMTKKEINSLVLNEAKYSVELVEIGRLLWSSVVLVVCVFCELN